MRNLIKIILEVEVILITVYLFVYERFILEVRGRHGFAELFLALSQGVIIICLLCDSFINLKIEQKFPKFIKDIYLKIKMFCKIIVAILLFTFILEITFNSDFRMSFNNILSIIYNSFD